MIRRSAKGWVDERRIVMETPMASSGRGRYCDYHMP